MEHIAVYLVPVQKLLNSKQKTMFITTIGFIGLSVANAIPVKCFSRSNQEYKITPAMVNTNSNEPFVLSIQGSYKQM